MFKKIISTVFAILVALVVILGIFKIVPEYMQQHPYYYEMLKSGLVWKVMVNNILISFLTALFLYFVFNSSVNRKIIRFVGTLYLMLFVFWVLYIKFKWEIIGSWLFMWFINSLLMFVIIIIFITFLLLIWTWIKERFLKLPTVDIFWVVTNFWIGLSVFLLLNYLLILLNILHPLISWVLLIVAIWLIYFKRDYLKVNLRIIEEVLNKWFDYNEKSALYVIFVILLLTFSLMYLNYWFLMSWIPYPTAWDANHAYMFYPKMWALNHWFYWNEPGMNTTPYLWLAYITYWFSLFVPFYDKFWIAPDTWAVEMNFLSGIFVLIFWLALVREVLNIIDKLNNINSKINDNIKQSLFLLWWFLLLLWLTSGMGAFLVFVDNKTDLWVLTLIILALYGWFLAFRKIIEGEGKGGLKREERSEEINIENWSYNKFSPDYISFQNSSNIISYLLLSAFFFAVAVASKPTAFFDVVNFAWFVSIYFLGIFVGIFIFLAAIFVLGYLQFRGIKNYFTKEISILLFGKPAVLTGILGIFEVILKRSFKYIPYLFIWGIAFVIFLVMIKWVWLIWELIFYPDRFKSLKDIFMTLFFG